MYNIQLEKAPNSYVFIKNGSYYDIYGEKAKELAEKYSKETIEENGKTVVSFDIDELDTVIREVVDGGSQARIIETPSLEKEVEFIQEEDRIAQMVIAKVEKATIEVTTELATSARGEGGFGSTGV